MYLLLLILWSIKQASQIEEKMAIHVETPLDEKSKHRMITETLGNGGIMGRRSIENIEPPFTPFLSVIRVIYT